MEITLTLNGNDISKDLEPHFINLTYVDKLSGEADTLDLTLADPKKIFLNDMPKRGSSIAVTIAELDAGSFEVDELSYSSPPSTLKIEDDSQEVLYSYRNTGALSPYTPSGQGAVLLNLILNLVTVVDNATNIYAILDASLLYVTQAQLLTLTTPHRIRIFRNLKATLLPRRLFGRTIWITTCTLLPSTTSPNKF